MAAMLEHTNLTVSDPDATASWMCNIFDWTIRWSGAAISGGRSVHVGSDDRYLALYTPQDAPTPSASSYETTGGLNHIGLVVDDLAVAEQRVKAAGFTPHSHADYEPGKRFYFHDADRIEYELVSYT